jgi:hypothetical protein
MEPQEEFELALQKYECAVREYVVAQERLYHDVGPFASARILQQAGYRICRATSPPGSKVIVMSQEEVDRQAALASPVVDSLQHNG